MTVFVWLQLLLISFTIILIALQLMAEHGRPAVPDTPRHAAQ